jgi:hypothetical protein
MRSAVAKISKNAMMETLRAVYNVESFYKILREYGKKKINPVPYKYPNIKLSELITKTYRLLKFYQYGIYNYNLLEVCNDFCIFYSTSMINE